MKIAALFLILITGICSHAQILDRAEVAFELSKESQKPVLLVFAGSDWCAPCIRLQNTILSDDQFQQYASDHFILLKVDFPQRKKLDKSLRDINEQLAEKYNPKGQFPHILLLQPDQSVLSILYYKNQKADEFISQLSTHFAE